VQFTRADLAEVEARRDDVPHPPDHAIGDQGPQADEGRMVTQDVADHEHAAGGVRARDHVLDVRARHGDRLLDVDVLARGERGGGEAMVARPRRRDHDRADAAVAQHVREGRGAPAMLGGKVRDALGRVVDEGGEHAELAHVAHQVLAPIAAAHHRDPRPRRILRHHVPPTLPAHAPP
jgi:hypothetical protein